MLLYLSVGLATVIRKKTFLISLSVPIGNLEANILV